MSDSRQNEKQAKAPAETARQEGVPDIVMGRTGKTAADMSDGAVDASDTKMAQEITEIADQVHASA